MTPLIPMNHFEVCKKVNKQPSYLSTLPKSYVISLKTNGPKSFVKFKKKYMKRMAKEKQAF